MRSDKTAATTTPPSAGPPPSSGSTRGLSTRPRSVAWVPSNRRSGTGLTDRVTRDRYDGEGCLSADHVRSTDERRRLMKLTVSLQVTLYGVAQANGGNNEDIDPDSPAAAARARDGRRVEPAAVPDDRRRGQRLFPRGEPTPARRPQRHTRQPSAATADSTPRSARSGCWSWDHKRTHSDRNAN